MFKVKLSKIIMRIFYIIFALVVSVTLWMYVEITENYNQDHEISNIGLDYRNEDLLRDRGLLIASVLTDIPLSIRFEGSRSDISKLLAPGALTVEVDLAEITSTGTKLMDYDIIWPQGVNPNDIEILNRSASRIVLLIDRELERQIPVKVSYTGGTASEELIAENVEYDPQMITVWGPEEAVSKIHYVRVPIFRENLSTTYREELEFLLYGEDDEELDHEVRESLEFSHETINVTVPIMEMKDVPLTVDLFHGVGTSDATATVSITPQTVKVSGDPEVIKDINNFLLGTIDMLSFGLSDTFAFPIIIPNIIKNESGEVEALVHVEVLGMDVAYLSTSNLQTINTPSGYRSDIVTQSLDIRIRGTSEDLSLVTPLNLRVVADLTDLSPGTKRVPAKIYIDGIEAYIDPVGEYEITISIILDVD